MRFLKGFRTLAMAGALSLIATVAGAADKAVQFDVTFKGSVDCQSPRAFNNLPLSFKGTMTMVKDGRATADITMTAAYLVSFKYKMAAKLGAKPVDQGGGIKASFRVRNSGGLALNLDFPTTNYLINIDVNGKRCAAELLPQLKPGESQYTILADDKYFYCDGFRIKRSTCAIKEVAAPR